jgi:hypothetical protein
MNMKSHEALNIAPPLRIHAGDFSAGTPLVSLVWHARREEHNRVQEQRSQESAERQRLLGALAAAAETAFRLRRSGEARIGAGLADELAKAGVEIVAPEGEPYEGLYTELLDNSAQRFEALLSGSRVAEVLTPAVVYQGAILRRGKAVIALPLGESQAADTSSDEGTGPATA